MNDTGANFWTDKTSVLFTSFWGWRPETWATVGWSNEEGRSYRDKILGKLTDPFITVIYVTRDPQSFDPDLVGKIAGFYLVSHETGDRNDFTHPVHHRRYPEKWRYSLRALRAFSYIADPPLIAKEVEPAIRTGAAQAIARWGKILNDTKQIAILRNAPWREVPIYRPEVPTEILDEILSTGGMVPAGPIASQPYSVSPNSGSLGWRLYVLRLDGDANAFLGKPAGARTIYKIGLSTSPDARRQSLQKALPRGAFCWRTDRTSSSGSSYDCDAAVAGEYAMKQYLAENADWLGGEFYLASKSQIKEAWRRGVAAANSMRDNR